MPSDAVTAVKRGKVVVISGPSGTGKTSICNQLLDKLPNAVWSVSATTRPPRKHEIGGELLPGLQASYDYVSKEEFQAMLDRGEFLESAEYVGHMYGTPRGPVEKALSEGNHVIVEIEVQGGTQVAQQMPESIRVFVLPPTRETLEARLKGRKTESAANLKKRLAQADGEIAVARDSGYYQYFVVNDDLHETVAEIMDIIRKETETQ